jgi:hypothetical protein
LAVGGAGVGELFLGALGALGVGAVVVGALAGTGAVCGVAAAARGAVFVAADFGGGGGLGPGDAAASLA